jgi:hypothetical protein
MVRHIFYSWSDGLLLTLPVKVESQCGSLKVKMDSRLRVGRRGLRRLRKRDFPSLGGYDQVLDIEDKVYSESFELIEHGLPTGV